VVAFRFAVTLIKCAPWVPALSCDRMPAAMHLDRGWHIIICFAFAGFFLPVLAYCLPRSVFSYLLIFASPGAWMFPELTMGDSLSKLFQVAFAAIANAVLYALAGALIAGLTSKPKE
jgi:hypothetical protein